MIEFSKCIIDPEGKELIIEAAVKSGAYYENVCIESTSIDTEETLSPTGPSSSPIFKMVHKVGGTYSVEPEVESQAMPPGGVILGPNNISLKLTPSMLNIDSLNDHIFFVYVKAYGAPTPEVPCGEDNIYTMAVAVNLSPIYKASLGYIKELEGDCKAPKGFIDMILKFKAFELALKTGNNLVAARYWTKFFKGKRSAVTFKSCGCNGTY